jgi:glucose-1-phosphate thymidylyltransferase
VVSNAEIENSIVLENSEISHVEGRIEASLLGKNVKIGRTKRKPVAYRFNLGDNSEVGIL